MRCTLLGTMVVGIILSAAPLMDFPADQRTKGAAHEKDDEEIILRFVVDRGRCGDGFHSRIRPSWNQHLLRPCPSYHIQGHNNRISIQQSSYADLLRRRR